MKFKQRGPGQQPRDLGPSDSSQPKGTPAGDWTQAPTDLLAGLSSDDLFHLAALRREEEQRREERFGVLLDGPALGAYRTPDAVDWRRWSHPVRLLQLEAIAADLGELANECGHERGAKLVAKAVLQLAVESGWTDLGDPEEAVLAGLRSVQRPMEVAA